MSLLQLLKVGRSLANIRDNGHQYKMAAQNLLPRFNATQPLSGLGGGGGVSGGTDSLFGRQALPPAPEQGEELASSRSKRGCWSGWFAKLFFWGRAGAPSDAAPAAGKAAFTATLRSSVRSGRGSNAQPLVQAELSLDRVRVVRNDLSEADLELIPARVAVAAPAVRAKSPQESGGRGMVWNRVTALFEARSNRG
jgi:hypothetical protein